MQIKDFLKIFGAIVLFHLAVIYRGDDGQMLWLSKPLIVGSLLLFTLSKNREGYKALGPIIIALFFSLAGDIALMFNEQAAFLIGMGSFALAHIFYIIWYLRLRSGLNLKALLLGVTISALALYLLEYYTSIPTDLSIAVYIYFALISLHMIFSLMAFAQKTITPYPIVGILFFVFSDWWIAWSKFGDALEEQWHNRLVIMLSYAIAQALICIGIIQLQAKPDLHHK